MDNIPNGGFPPIKYCKNAKKEKTEFTKERHFASSINVLFSSKNIKPVIIDINKINENNELYELNELDEV
jgi:hypothetical protein